MLAALDGHGFSWPTGKDRLLIISVGTGSYKETLSGPALVAMTAAEQGLRSLQSLMDDCARVNHGMLQWLTNAFSLVHRPRGRGHEPRQSERTTAREFTRLQCVAGRELAEERIGSRFGGGQDRANPQDGRSVQHEELAGLGAKAAKAQVKAEHMPAAFDLAAEPATGSA